MFDKLKNGLMCAVSTVSHVAGKMKSKALFLFALMGTMLAVHAEDTGTYTVTIPNGCNVGTWITNGITAMAAIVAVAIGGYVVFKILRSALGWISKGLGAGR